MNTFLLSSPCDSLTTKLYVNVFSCSPKVAEQGANWAEVITIGIICCSILIILLVLICKFFEWKKKELEIKKEEVNQKREWEIEDINRKQKSDLLDLKLKMLKELCDTEEYKKADVEKKKNIYSDVEKYIKAVETAIIGDNKVEGTTKDEGTERHD